MYLLHCTAQKIHFSRMVQLELRFRIHKYASDQRMSYTDSECAHTLNKLKGFANETRSEKAQEKERASEKERESKRGDEREGGTTIK